MKYLKQLLIDFHQIFIGMFVVFSLIIGYLFIQNQSNAQNSDWAQWLEETTRNFAEEDTVETSEEETLLFVDIKGEVKYPGIYQLTAGSRLFDLINMAGGLTEEANVSLINQAIILSDQMLVVIPNLNDAVDEYTIDQVISNPVAAVSDSRININTATIEELLQINGIGPKKAQAILDYRQSNGSFQSIEEITNVKGIGEKTFQSIADQITVK